MTLASRIDAASIEPTSLTQHLRANGWVEVKTTPARVGVASFVMPATASPHGRESDVRTLVPLDREFSDYGRRVAEIVELLAVLEGRPVEQVAADLRRPPADIVRFRLIGEGIEPGVLPLPMSNGFRSIVADVMLACAHSAERPVAHHQRLAMTLPVRFLDECREGPVERGSYIASVIVPVSPPVGLFPEDEADPFSRRVTRTLAKSLDAAADAASRGDVTRLCDLAPVGVSANLLDALSRVGGLGRPVQMETSLHWSRARPLRTSVPSVARFDSSAFVLFQAAARALRANLPPEAVALTGYVVMVSRERNETGDEGAGDIKLMVVSGDRPDAVDKVLARLPADRYRCAVDAHRDGKLVRLTGVLTRQGRVWRVESVASFEIEPDPDEG